MREEFEKFPYVADKLRTVVFNEKFNDYHAAMINSSLSVYYVRGAWYAYQEQQKRIDAVLDLVKDAQNGDYGFTCEGGDIDLFAKEINELLK